MNRDDGDDRIEREIVIDAPRRRVWELVSVPGWWINDGEIVAHLIEAHHGCVVVHDRSHGAFAIRLVESRPEEYVAFRWGSGPDPEKDLDAGRSTLVEFFLESASDDGLILRVVESGFAELETSARARRLMVDERTAGWVVELRAAGRHAEDQRS